MYIDTKSMFSLDEPIFSKDINYLKKMYINEEKTKLQKNIRLAGQDQTLSLFKGSEVDWEDFENQRQYRKQVCHEYSHYVLGDKGDVSFQGALGVLHLIAYQYARLYPEKFEIIDKEPKSSDYNPFHLTGTKLLDKIAFQTISLFPKPGEGKHPFFIAGELVDFDMVLASPLKEDLSLKQDSSLLEHEITALYIPTATHWDNHFLGKTMTYVHGARMDKPLEKAPLQSELSQMINRLLMRLTPIKELLDTNQTHKILERNNWFVKNNPHLIEHVDERGSVNYKKQITTHITKESSVLSQFYLRSEYETLLRMPGGEILFTIKPFVYCLSEVVQVEGMANKLLEGMESRKPERLPEEHIEAIKQALKENLSFSKPQENKKYKKNTLSKRV